MTYNINAESIISIESAATENKNEIKKVNMSIFQDWQANKGSIKSRLILLNYRTARVVRYNKVLLLFFFWYLPIYIIFIEWFLGVEFAWKINAGRGLTIRHGQALVVNPDVIIGNNCTLRHSTTIGNKLDKGPESVTKAPVIGNNVDVGCNVCIIGNITIGDNVIIGAGSVIVKSIPANSVVVGNPGRIVRTLGCLTVPSQFSQADARVPHVLI
jgi:putative colanic acid biosynthesis acetyltransferase WcaB